MTHFVSTTNLISLLWPLTVCAAAWGIVVWALRQRDQVSEAVHGLMSTHRSVELADRADPHSSVPSDELGKRKHKSVQAS